jgi:hypothetical protein
MLSIARSSRMVALTCLSATALRLFRDGFMRQPPSKAGAFAGTLRALALA